MQRATAGQKRPLDSDYEYTIPKKPCNSNEKLERLKVENTVIYISQFQKQEQAIESVYREKLEEQKRENRRLQRQYDCLMQDYRQTREDLRTMGKETDTLLKRGRDLGRENNMLADVNRTLDARVSKLEAEKKKMKEKIEYAGRVLRN
ncbi:hypothetical protein DM02DRAFT_724831 [Periconia macrospinosa]|uniref:Uncharacterized protein n=1 Tax=Periconia macrospinosa TaxID=97972 RepID=A0A2V1E542_9PLEO|nr:hypothetical protein DM02DRAFT_724831 [Periconia macrospinosa]